MERLLTRDVFREGVFARDGHRCVVCGEAAADAHHIMERRLFTEPHQLGGYFLSNGASLCPDHHMDAETTALSVEEVRRAAGVSVAVLPDHLEAGITYTKWGDVVLATGQRLRGELFNDESVQKVLAVGGFLDLYSDHVKYPRTYHLPYSEKASKDDRTLADTSCFAGRDVVATLKMDGENTSIYTDYTHARSLDSAHHPSQDWVKGLAGTVGYEIPRGWRICGENVYATHAIDYQNLDTYFYVLSIWDDRNVCLSYEETMEWCELLGLLHAPVLYAGPYDEALIRAAFDTYKSTSPDQCEGFVVRVAEEFHYGQFKRSVAKFVSGSFEIAERHWKSGKVVKNGLRQHGRG